MATSTHVNSYPCHLVSMSIVPISTRTHVNSFPCELVPMATRTHVNSYPYRLVPISTRTHTDSYPCQLVPLMNVKFQIVIQLTIIEPPQNTESLRMSGEIFFVSFEPVCQRDKARTLYEVLRRMNPWSPISQACSFNHYTRVSAQFSLLSGVFVGILSWREVAHSEVCETKWLFSSHLIWLDLLMTHLIYTQTS